MPTYKELKVQIASLAAQAEAARTAEINAIVRAIRATIAEYGLTEKDIFGGRRGRPKKKKAQTVAPKYLDPATGATWSGRGRAPRWIANAASRDQFLIGS
ncbi:H-NS histone family protein [Paraburkholderia caballeronis]|uniref:DNA-binding protein H-NS n=1 Tax=Paraburkholderia caballeronis TaxID=416943 RepID=A0A1H7TVH4_9BURK|nr:H-NS histone family protein [Paraburkholderia caballeronis]PXW17671.1 DNA-binding protein H-NS [Paraburkholderia caballeronis]PXW95416.1 DNA-binding protein H-NS [Paraburkholderia caballeronis]RAJ91230.1 DNA-binding protein H-NS [Paraburkholderia caballeronis]TDV23239.1 DNA-binding protein H-NS [Paraburkholderia caballeronis]SEE11859.1 DNA-binding protein H-NS [Paraburkholderia caballeronis]